MKNVLSLLFVSVLLLLTGCTKLISKLQNEPINTDFTNTNQEIFLSDNFGDNMVARILQYMPRSSSGGYLLAPGFYEMECMSYCLHAGKYGHSSGDGYLFAPLKGEKKDIVQSIIKNAQNFPEIEQRDIQLLLWAIIAKTNFNELSPTLKLTSTKLLTPTQIVQLNDGAVDVIAESVLDKAISALPSEIQQIIEVENDMRELFSSAEVSYSEMEQKAVLAGDAPAQNSGTPLGRWSKHPDGYFLRYFPSGYKSTKVQVYVPDVYDKGIPDPGKNGDVQKKENQMEFDATDDIAMPANSSAQRLAQSNEPAGTGDKCQRCNCVKYAIVHVEQPDEFTCWSASFEMAFGRSPVISNPNMLNENGELLLDQIPKFALDNNIRMVNENMTLTPEALKGLLNNGPVWIIGQLTLENPNPSDGPWHGSAIGGYEQDCETGELYLDLYDPLVAPDEGGISSLLYAQLLEVDPLLIKYIYVDNSR